MTGSARNVVLCNGAPRRLVPRRRNDVTPLILDYSKPGRVRLKLPQFVREVGSLSYRTLDLLEVAGYVFAADRLIDRGARDQLLFQSWGRSLAFGVRVRDADFWMRSDVRQALSALLTHLTGDISYEFHFEGGYSTPPAHLFDDQTFRVEPDKSHFVALFSGGLDSLSGVFDRLTRTDDVVCLVSHRSGSPSTSRTQQRLALALRTAFPGRVKQFGFETGLSTARAITETQRTRTFLYGAVAYAIVHSLSHNAATVFENGVTSINLARRQDLLNARASRTTHPKTLFLLANLLSLIGDTPFVVDNPYRWSTKAEVLTHLAAAGGSGLISSSVSCSRTNLVTGTGTHCGTCLQCIDRRFAIVAAGLEEYDPRGLYSVDFLDDSLSEPEARTALLDYVRLGISCGSVSEDAILGAHFAELAQLPTPQDGDEETVREACYLLKRFGQQVLKSLSRFNASAQLTVEPQRHSLHGMIATREYLRSPLESCADAIEDLVRISLPKMFAKNPPLNENDLNDKIHGLVSSQEQTYRREFPAVEFATSRVVPDHESTELRLILETKYTRAKSSIGKVSDEMAADLVKYPSDHYIVFVVYDPDRAIRDDHEFASSFASHRPCRIIVVR